MRGVMMKEHKSLRFGPVTKSGSQIDGTVSPSRLAFIFLLAILGIVYQ